MDQRTKMRRNHRSKKPKESHAKPQETDDDEPSDITYSLKKFDIKTVRPFSTLLFAGARRTGKSFAMRDWLYHLRHRFYDAYVWSGSHEEDNPWEKFVPEKYVSYTTTVFPEEEVQVAMARQRTRCEISKKHNVACPGTAFIYEDLEFLSKPMWKYQSIREQMLAGRHSKCYSIAAVQYLIEVPMKLRGMFDYAIFMSENNKSTRERIHKQFCGVVKYDEFEKIFMACTADHGCMVVDCRSTSYNVEDIIFHYKAENHGFFRLGVKEVWDAAVDERNRAYAESLIKKAPEVVAAQTLKAREKVRGKKGKKDIVVGVKLM